MRELETKVKHQKFIFCKALDLAQLMGGAADN